MEIFKETLIPAYGRDYKSLEEVKDAVYAGADFRLSVKGSYTSAPELLKMGFGGAWIRYDKLRRKTFVCFVYRAT